MKKLIDPILSGRTTSRSGRQKHYNNIRFSGWTINKNELMSMLNNSSNYDQDDLKRNVRIAISEAEGAIQKLSEYQTILETLNSTSYTPVDINRALLSLASSTLNQKDIHTP